MWTNCSPPQPDELAFSTLTLPHLNFTYAFACTHTQFIKPTSSPNHPKYLLVRFSLRFWTSKHLCSSLLFHFTSLRRATGSCAQVCHARCTIALYSLPLSDYIWLRSGRGAPFHTVHCLEAENCCLPQAQNSDPHQQKCTQHKNWNTSSSIYTLAADEHEVKPKSPTKWQYVNLCYSDISKSHLPQPQAKWLNTFRYVFHVLLTYKSSG